MQLYSKNIELRVAEPVRNAVSVLGVLSVCLVNCVSGGKLLMEARRVSEGAAESIVNQSIVNHPTHRLRPQLLPLLMRRVSNEKSPRAGFVRGGFELIPLISGLQQGAGMPASGGWPHWRAWQTGMSARRVEAAFGGSHGYRSVVTDRTSIQVLLAGSRGGVKKNDECIMMNEESRQRRRKWLPAAGLGPRRQRQLPSLPTGGSGV
jgi:hypothetical protein